MEGELKTNSGVSKTKREKRLMRRSMKSIGVGLLMAAFCFQISVVSDVQGADADKKREELLRKIQKLREKKARMQQEAQKKLNKQSGPKQSLSTIIDRYEKLYSSCQGKKSMRCADVM